MLTGTLFVCDVPGEEEDRMEAFEVGDPDLGSGKAGLFRKRSKRLLRKAQAFSENLLMFWKYLLLFSKRPPVVIQNSV